MRPHVLSAVFRRNVAGYFSGVLGYLLIIAFVVGVAFLLFDPAFFTANLATLDSLSERFPLLLLFIVPAITMTAWAEERKLGTDELLFTMPATAVEILLGKYLAVLAVYTVLLLFTLPHLAILGWLGDPDWGLILTTYLGYWLAGAALLALGLLASAMTSNTTVAFVLGVALCAIPVFLGRLPIVGDWVEHAALPAKLTDFAIGTIPISAVFYFAAIAAFGLYLNLVAITRRFWSARTENGGMGWQMAVRAVAVLIGVWSLTSILSAASGRVDLTQERLFTLSDATAEVIAGVPKDRPVLIQAYLSDEVPADFQPIKQKLLGLLRQIDSEGGSRIDVRVTEIEPFSEEAEEAEIAGIEPREMIDETPDGSLDRQNVFFGMTVSSGYDQVKVPFFERGTGVEYQLARAIGTVSREERLTVGVLRTDANVMGAPASQFGQQPQPQWRIIDELEKQYEVRSIDTGSLQRIVDGDESAPQIDVLLAVLPSSLVDAEMDTLVAYIESGGPVAIFDDPAPVSSVGLTLAPSQEKPSPGGPMGGGPSGEQKADGGRATRLLRALGIAWDTEALVFDTLTPHPKLEDALRPEFVFIRAESGVSDAVSQRHPVTRGLQEVLTFAPGVLQPYKYSRKTFSPLLRSAVQSTGTLRFDDAFAQSRSLFGGGLEQRDESQIDYRVDDQSHTIAAAIFREAGGDDRKPQLPTTPCNVVFVADIDMIGDFFFNVATQKIEDLALDNVTFLMNALDHLAGEDRYIEVRSRRPRFRTLDRLDRQKQAVEQARAQRKAELRDELEDELNEYREKERELVDRINDDDSLSGIQKQQAYRLAQRQLERNVALRVADRNEEFDREADQLSRTAERQERRIEKQTRLLATMISPLPALFLGAFVLFTRLSDERRGADRNRIVPD